MADGRSLVYVIEYIYAMLLIPREIFISIYRRIGHFIPSIYIEDKKMWGRTWS